MLLTLPIRYLKLKRQHFHDLFMFLTAWLPSLGIGWSQAMNASAVSEASKLSSEDDNDDEDDDERKGGERR